MSFNGTGPAHNLDEVAEKIEIYLAYFRERNDPLGYFPALYRKVAHKLEAKIHEGYFEDKETIIQVDICFVNRYLAAMDAIVQGKTPTASWGKVYEASRMYWPIVLQHLMLGMNAHINLDLSVAVAQVCGENIEKFHEDFNRVNEVLLSLLDDVEGDLAEIFPPLALYNKLFGRFEDAVIGFSMKTVRKIAWERAEHLAEITDPEKLAEAIDAQDQLVSQISEGIIHPHSGFVEKALSLVRILELGSVRSKIDKLADLG